MWTENVQRSCRMMDSNENGGYRLSWGDIRKWKTYCKPVNQGGSQIFTVLSQKYNNIQ